MMNGTIKYAVSAVIFLGLFCSRKETPGPVAVNPSGTVVALDASGERGEVRHGMGLQSGNVVKTLPGSKVRIALSARDTLYLDENSGLRIDPATQEAPPETWTATLLYGNCFAAVRSNPGITLHTPRCAIQADGAYAAFSFFPDHDITIVQNFSGPVTAQADNRSPVTVGSCRKILFKKSGEHSPLVSVSESDIDSVTTWAVRELVSSIVAISGCGEAVHTKINQPPRWRGTPRIRCEPDIAFRDTLRAVDPEGDSVRFRLIGGPAGMKMTDHGVISYMPRAPETHEIHVRALDHQNNSIDRTYHLTVTGRVGAVLSLPATAAPGDSVLVDASSSVNERGNAEGLSYRFDLDNDGAWDIPRNGGFGKQSAIRTAFQQECLCTIGIEVASKTGKTARTQRSILINEPPRARLSVLPEKGASGEQFTFDASQSGDSRDAHGQLRYRWDFNSDGVWDFPDTAEYAVIDQVYQMWIEPGEYRVTVEVLDSHNAVDTASAAVHVVEGLTIHAISGPDTTARFDTASFFADMEDRRRKIEEYAWDLNGDGDFELKTDTPSIRYAFSSSGAFEISCKATDSDGFSAMRTRTIFVKKRRNPKINAGGTFTINVGDTCTLTGTVEDPDSMAGVWHWDFNGDGKEDWQSRKLTPRPVVYPDAGTFHAIVWTITRDSVRVADTAVIRAENRGPRAFAGNDVASRPGRRVKLEGRGEDADGNIETYEWDFDGDGAFDWKSESTGVVKHAFNSYSQAVFRVRDREGLEDLDTVRIVICPDDMALVEQGLFCIDTYEWPNKKGAMPLRDVTREQARAYCDEAGKKLCSGAQWQQACEGADNGGVYPYGNGFEQKKCNTLGNKKVDNRAARSGEFNQCVNAIGCYDMSGNAAEWTSSGHGDRAHVYGGFWQSGEKHSTCASFIPLDESKGYLYVGFRCCK